MQHYTQIILDAGVLEIRTEGVVRDSRWRRAIQAGIQWLRAQGGGSMLLPHT